jgi:hypothetical protein
MNTAKDLSLEAPRGPRELLGGYAILARCIDKGRAELNGTAGEFHFNCPLDNMLFSFKGVDSDDVHDLLQNGSSDEKIVQWFNENGAPKTEQEIAAWTAEVSLARPHNDPDKRDWFAGECERLGLDPAETTLFEYLEEDDRQLNLQSA